MTEFFTLRPEAEGLRILDQTLLPYHCETRLLQSLDEVVAAIRDMRVRGAPLIGAAAAWGVVLALRADPGDAALARALAALAAARPTAVNLHWALARMERRLAPLAPAARAAAAQAEAAAICREDEAANRAIGEHGLALLRRMGDRPLALMTHCNAGWLATAARGTALAPVYAAQDAGLPVTVWVSETRPRNQGLLTAWELARRGVPHTLIADNAAGHLLRSGRVDAVIVGADRIAANGDTANKVGTYLKALAARDCGVPFYVAAPASTIDWSCADGAGIPIEERAGDEVRRLAGTDGAGQPLALQLADAATAVANPAFDVTPARLITGIITERGVCGPGELRRLFPEAGA